MIFFDTDVKASEGTSIHNFSEIILHDVTHPSQRKVYRSLLVKMAMSSKLLIAILIYEL